MRSRTVHAVLHLEDVGGPGRVHSGAAPALNRYLEHLRSGAVNLVRVRRTVGICRYEVWLDGGWVAGPVGFVVVFEDVAW